MLAPAYLGLIIFIILFEIYREKTTIIDFLTVFNISFFLCYPFPGFLLESNLGESRTKLLFNSDIYHTNPHTIIAIFLGYFFVIIGYYSASSQRFASKLVIKNCSNQSLINYSILLFIFSAISTQIYASQFGGLNEALDNTILIRTNEIQGGSLGFFKHFVLFCNVSSFLLTSLLKTNDNINKKILIFTLLIASIILSILTFTLTAGRSNMIKYFTTFAIAYMIQNKNINLKKFSKIIPLLCAFPFLIIYGRRIFRVLSSITGGIEAVVDSFNDSVFEESDRFDFYEFMGNFVYPFHSLEVSLEKEYQWRLFVDFIYGIVSFLPERLLNISGLPLSITFYNTTYIVGTVDYGIPPGLLALGVYSLSWFGLVILCFSYGWIAQYTHTLLCNHMRKISWIAFVYAIAIQVWVDFTFAGDFEVLLTANLWFFLSVIPLFIFVCKVSISSGKANQTSSI